MKKSIYVAATGQHVGKTTSTLGLTAALSSLDLRGVGYCKPVGQEVKDFENLRVDKDAFLFSRIMNFELSQKIHSPVILGKGATTDYLDDPSKYPYQQNILEAADFLHRHNEVVVYEGTGHPGVGSIVNLSNADVAKLLNAKVVMVVEGGIGNTIDKLNMSLALFREKKVPIIGVIVNKVLPKKMEKVEHYVGKKLEQMGIPLLGLLPYEKRMSYPIMYTVKEAIKGKAICNEKKLLNRIEKIIPGSLVYDVENIHKQNNQLLVVSYKRANESIRTVEMVAAKMGRETCPLAGIILTGRGRLNPGQGEHPTVNMDYINKHQIPVVSTHLDTLGAYTKINQIEVKINTDTPWKVRRAIELIKNHVDLEKIMASF